MKTALFLFLLIGLVITIAIIYLKKEDKKTRFTSGRITKISPVFKGSNKVEYWFQYNGQPFTGYTLANERVSYIINHHYTVYFDPSSPSDSKITPIQCSPNNIPSEGWEKPQK